MPINLDSPLDSDEAAAWLTDPSISLLRKIAAAAWLISDGSNSISVGRQVGMSASTIRHWARLSHKLAPSVLERLRRPSRPLSIGHLKALAALPYPAQLPMLERCIAYRYSVRKVEALVQSGLAEQDEAAHYAHLSEHMSLKLGFEAIVRAERGKPGAGKVTIVFHSLDEFDALCTRLRIDLSDL